MTYNVWHEETEIKLKEARNKEIELREKSRKTEQEANQWKEIGDALEKVLSLYKKQYPNGHALSYETLRQKSTWENLLDIMNANGGKLVVVDAVTLLVDAKVFSDRETARNTIYSTLNHHKRDVKWVNKGVYEKAERKDGRKPKKQKIRGKTSGVKDAIKRIKETNPQISKNEVLRYLKQAQFDFKGRNPNSAVTMAWNSLGYAKEGQQQSLPV